MARNGLVGSLSRVVLGKWLPARKLSLNAEHGAAALSFRRPETNLALRVAGTAQPSSSKSSRLPLTRSSVRTRDRILLAGVEDRPRAQLIVVNVGWLTSHTPTAAAAAGAAAPLARFLSRFSVSVKNALINRPTRRESVPDGIARLLVESLQAATPTAPAPSSSLSEIAFDDTVLPIAG